MGEGDNGVEHDDRVKRYDMVLRHLASENGLFWTRCQLFLVASAALLGFALKVIYDLQIHDTWRHTLIALFAGMSGLCLSVLWHLAIGAGHAWLEHWRTILKELEPMVFGETPVIRGRPTLKRGSTRVARDTAWLFTIVWSLSTLYVIVLIGVKLAC